MYLASTPRRCGICAEFTGEHAASALRSNHRGLFRPTLDADRALMSNFAFLAAEFPAVHEAAVEAERQAACRRRRRRSLPARRSRSRSNGHSAADPESEAALSGQYRGAAARAELSRARRARRCSPRRRYINTLRNRAVHEEKTISPGDATGAVKELFHVCFWLARTYARKAKPADGLAFDASVLVAPRRGAEKGLRPAQGAAGRAGRQERRTDQASDRQAEPRRRVEDASRRGRRRAQGGRGAARQAQLQRGRNPRPLYRPAAARGRLGARQARRPRIPRRGHAEQRGHRLRRLRAVGRGRQAAGAGRGQAHPQGRARGPAAGQALCRLPGGALRPAPGDLLFQRLRALDLGRYALSAAPDRRLLQARRTGTC